MWAQAWELQNLTKSPPHERIYTALPRSRSSLLAPVLLHDSRPAVNSICRGHAQGTELRSEPWTLTRTAHRALESILTSHTRPAASENLEPSWGSSEAPDLPGPEGAVTFPDPLAWQQLPRPGLHLAACPATSQPCLLPWVLVSSPPLVEGRVRLRLCAQQVHSKSLLSEERG